MINELKYFTEGRLEVMVGGIIEFPNKQMEYLQTDLVGIVDIIDGGLLGHKLKLSDGYEILVGGSEFWKAKLVARRII